MAFIGAFLTGGIWMREIYLKLAVLQQRQVGKLRSIITCNGLEYFVLARAY